MIDFDKSFTVLIAKHIPDKNKEKLNKNAEFISFGDDNDVEGALAGAYIAYLTDQGINLSQDQKEDLLSKIETSLKRYKRKAKN